MYLVSTNTTHTNPTLMHTNMFVTCYYDSVVVDSDSAHNAVIFYWATATVSSALILYNVIVLLFVLKITLIHNSHLAGCGLEPMYVFSQVLVGQP